MIQIDTILAATLQGPLVLVAAAAIAAVLATAATRWL